MKIQHYLVFIFMGIAVVARGYAEDIPGWSKIIIDTASIATGLAALVMRPPWEASSVVGVSTLNKPAQVDPQVSEHKV